jgi:glutathione S-transferase
MVISRIGVHSHIRFDGWWSERGHPVIELHQFPRVWGINPGPFCLKVEFYLRLAGIPYRPVVTMPFRAPRGKLPFIVDGGRRIPDSGHIIDHLRRTTTDLDGGLDQQQLALGHLLRRACEESLYFVLVYARWMDEAGWAAMRPALASMLPPGLRAVIVPFARRVTRRALHAQGYGRHTREEIYAMGAADLAAINTMLAGRAFAVADRPTSFDAALYAVLLSIMHPPIETPLKQSAQQHPGLLDYAARIARMLPPPSDSL